ncbi:MAG: hypothetical protein EOO42_11375 [Flavobacteriales bacterium]|nr:MAG: hypothetical protein EOO42_11375 [Flavobacteriales bacterium]
MERYRYVIMLLLSIAFFGCKKKEVLDPEIAVEKVYVETVASDRIELNYTLSHLGYGETGVAYAKKSDPSQLIYVNAIRLNGVLKLALQNLEPNTDYIFKVFFEQNGERKIDLKEYSVKTLTKEAQLFKLQVVGTSVNYDDNGNFTLLIEGDNLNNLNLKEFELKIGVAKLTFGYPVLVSGNKYHITAKGIVNPVNASNAIVANYQEKEIMFQSVPFVFDGERFWLTYKPTSFRGYYVSVFGADLYYFYDNQVFRWDDTAQRMVMLTSIPDGTIQANSVGVQFDNQLFFPVVSKRVWPNPKDLYDYNVYPEAYSFEVGSTKWTSFPFLDQAFGKANREIEIANYFIHKDELYLAYTVKDGSSAIPTTNINRINLLYHYNKVKKDFEKIDFNAEVIHYSFVAVNNKLYLSGLAPVYDQGFKVSATFVVYEVADNFTLKEIYRAGTTNNPLSIISKYTIAYENKILVGISTSDFLLFDPAVIQLYQVYLRNNFTHTYFNGFFRYNNKLHLNADLLSTSQKIYEISIVKGR